MDLFDDPTHGDQQLTFFHGFYDQYQYQVRVITCAENDMTVLPVLLYGTAHASPGTATDLHRVIEHIRQRFPDVQILVRCDSGFAVPSLYETLESLQVEYSIGLAMNSRLKTMTDELLESAVQRSTQTQRNQRLFTLFDYQAGSWSRSRIMVVKCEANAQGTDRRAIVTNRAGAPCCPQESSDAYADRGESENRNKELKCELRADRLSDHRYLDQCVPHDDARVRHQPARADADARRPAARRDRVEPEMPLERARLGRSVATSTNVASRTRWATAMLAPGGCASSKWRRESSRQRAGSAF